MIKNKTSDMKLFTVGPVMMHDYTLKTAGRQVPYFRTNEFSAVVKEIDVGLKELLDAPEAQIALLTASGTGGMEAVVQTLDPGRKALVINGGSFGQRFVELLSLHGIPFDQVVVDFNRDLDEALLDPYMHCDYQALLVNIHETSIGKYYDPELIKDFCTKKNCFLIVDAISSFLADPFHMRDIGADAVILSSQKALALDAGLSIVAISKRYYDNIKSSRRLRCRYLDINEHLLDAQRGQTPFTPAINTIYQLRERIEKIIHSGGVKTEIEHTSALALHFRKQIASLPFIIPSYTKSNCLTPILCPQNNALTLFNICKDRYKVYLTPCGGKYKNSLLRVGHIGDLSIEDIDGLIDILKEIL